MAPEDAHKTDVLQENLVHSDLFNLASRETDDEDAAVPRGTLCAGVDHANGVVDNVDTAPAGGELLHLRGPLGIAVVDDVVGAEGLCDVELARGGGRSDDGGAEGLCDLDGGQADAAGGGMDEDDVAGLDAGADDESAVGGRGGDEEAGGFLEGPAVRDGEELLLAGDALLGEGALCCAEDAGADGEFGLGRGF